MQGTLQKYKDKIALLETEIKQNNTQGGGDHGKKIDFFFNNSFALTFKSQSQFCLTMQLKARR